jgi:hypothetical protein
MMFFLLANFRLSHYAILMSSEKMTGSPLDPLRKASEEAYFHKQNKELAAKLKARAAMKDAGVTDPQLADELMAAGFDEDSLKALFLIPALEVAWVDGRAQDEEKAEIRKLAVSHGMTEGSAGWALVEGWLSQNPAEDLRFQNGRALLAPLFEGLKKTGNTAWVREAAERVAAATGGLFGLGSKISAHEQEVLDRLGKKLS